MRLRVERKIRKQSRLLRRLHPELAAAVDETRRVESVLSNFMLDPGNGWWARGTAARLLSMAVRRQPARQLLHLFHTQAARWELWETALALETLGDRACIAPLIRALEDENPHRRQAAARALGWIPKAGARAAKALMVALQDGQQPLAVREEAAESLAYLGYAPAIPALISMLRDPNVGVRFWAVFALGSLGRKDGRADLRASEALEGMCEDREAPPGGWWTVGKEALASLAQMDSRYGDALRVEIDRVFKSGTALDTERRWAEFYDPRGSRAARSA